LANIGVAIRTLGQAECPRGPSGRGGGDGCWAWALRVKCNVLSTTRPRIPLITAGTFGTTVAGETDARDIRLADGVSRRPLAAVGDPKLVVYVGDVAVLPAVRPRFGVIVGAEQAEIPVEDVVLIAPVLLDSVVDVERIEFGVATIVDLPEFR